MNGKQLRSAVFFGPYETSFTYLRASPLQVTKAEKCSENESK